jgi:hypothetical protein
LTSTFLTASANKSRTCTTWGQATGVPEMPYLYHVMRPNGSATCDGSVDGIEEVVVDGAAGQYLIDKVDLDLRTARHTSRRSALPCLPPSGAPGWRNVGQPQPSLIHSGLCLAGWCAEPGSVAPPES